MTAMKGQLYKLLVLMLLLVLCLQTVEGLRGALFRTGRSGSATSYPNARINSDPMYAAYYRLARRYNDGPLY
ncbi:hypothetical protein PRIPAC_70975 [Pristionchus pacificus]|uniref:Uncharacterized protein n=1 Tax=Pristionchus pacificus TaxID=54126 RepID=A0A2A6C7D5_PRIPA|nr:hypothetical protein PRIPAC_70975 [Pristionchus pacificus]|eukprot:PDM74122.1 hypothetical protein PRIPAC_41478 [Pristionchus pacificus]